MDYDEWTTLLKALAHPARLKIVNMLRQGETCVCHMEKALDKRQAYVSQQLMVLRKAGLVTSRRVGGYIFYRLVDKRVAAILEVLGDPYEFTGHQARTDCHCAICEALRMSKTT